MQISTRFLEAVHTRKPVSGYTHDFYRYPARFSPLFAREAIRQFTVPGDTVLDPFMGGGTSLVEAHVQDRNAIGTDISSLAVFITQTKTTPLSNADIFAVQLWADSTEAALNLHTRAVRDSEWSRMGYQRNISTRTTWPIRKTLELALARVPDLETPNQQQFARCVLLKTAQWALDCRTHLPTARELRQQFRFFLAEMVEGVQRYSKAVRKSDVKIVCMQRSAVGIENDAIWNQIPRPKLIITSPPYPGVHVLYHRWQIHGRKETPAPFWIAGTLDGCGASFYTFGDRKQRDLGNYYAQAGAAFRSVARVAGKGAILVQMVAFADPTWQLSEYLAMLEYAGFREERLQRFSNSRDGRIWRAVPNRKWYATQKGEIAPSKEVLLVHRLLRKPA